MVRELAIRLKQSSDVTVACLSRAGPVGDQLHEAGVRVVAFDARGPLDLISTVRRLISLIRGERFDVVFSFLIHANTVAAIASRFCPGVRFLQSIQTTQPNPRWHWKLQSLVHHAAERIVEQVGHGDLRILAGLDDLIEGGVADAAVEESFDEVGGGDGLLLGVRNGEGAKEGGDGGEGFEGEGHRGSFDCRGAVVRSSLSAFSRTMNGGFELPN